MKYWLGVVSKEHVERGRSEGIAQVCHGKRAPLARMKKGDWLVYYSPKTSRNDGAALQHFTAIGQIADDDVYKYEVSEDFHPFRRKVDYMPCQAVPLEPLKDKLSLTQEKNWGYKLRFGLIQLSEADFSLIKKCMILG